MPITTKVLSLNPAHGEIDTTLSLSVTCMPITTKVLSLNPTHGEIDTTLSLSVTCNSGVL